ncbi:MAG: IPT/TIG domain-containing protein [Bacteroidota bacterium]
MTTFTNKLRLIPVLVAVFLVGLTSCKKNDSNPNPAPETAVPKLTGKLDGKDINLTAANLTSTYYTSSGDAVSSLETSAALDANGSKLNFFIDDLKNGTINITPKLGSSANPGNPNQKVLATAGPVVQTYISYLNNGNTYYALSGFVKIEIDPSKGLTVSWEISFKDATGRVFTSAGSFFLPIYTANPKPKTEVKDPTPVAAKPTIDNIAPTSGIAGDTISIAGTNYSTTAADNVVKFNNTQATVISATATKLMVVAPQGGTSGDLTLKVKNSEQIIGPAFTYIIPATFTALSPSSGAVADVITLTGTNFSTVLTDNLVHFNGVPGQVKSATATTITVAVPTGATTGAIAIFVKGKRATPAQAFTTLFTVTVPTTNPPVVVVGDPGQAYILNGSYSAFAKASDNEGNLYVVDENQQLFKMSPSGQILKSFTKNDITFKSMNSYKCVAITSNKKGAIRALFYCPTAPNGQVEVYMVAIGTSGTISKEFQTTLFDQEYAGMVWDNNNYYVLSNHFNTDDVIKINGTDGTFAVYLKGGAGGDFDGNGAYSMDLDGSNNLFVLSYLKGPNTSSIPTKHAIYKFDSQKVKTTILGAYTDGYQDGELATAKFKDIRSLVVSNQDLFVGDNGGYRIRKIAPRTNLVTTLAGNGKQFEASNGNQPLYVGGLLNVNMRGSNGLMLNTFTNALYNFSSGQVSFQKFVLN